MDNQHAYMKACQAQTCALPSDDVQQEEDCMDCDEEQLGAEPCNNDT